ncbi:GRAM domain protein [Aspergillus sclerotialis]|uniref:GRAM domain protein n=1 Tax=Aspergillus sclerotialis TaxID=2070753 RepID=A0A3A2Z5L7_9EURO|nr:GRAM domain protein [Aspergillus sclerotialis]
MDSTSAPVPPPTPPSGMEGFNKSNRTWTTPGELEGNESSSRSNGRSSVDSTSSRPKTQAGEAPDPVKHKTLSKLLRRRKKHQNQKEADEILVPDDDKDIHSSQSTNSQDGNSGESSVNTNPSPPDNESPNILTDDSEPDRTPPLTSHNSHSGFYTTSSPLIHSTSADEPDASIPTEMESAVSGNSAPGSESNPDTDLSRSSTQPASTLDIPRDRNGKKRGVSPGRRLKEAFGSNKDKEDPDKSNNSSERGSVKSSGGKSGRSLFSNRSRSKSASASAQKDPTVTEPRPPLPPPIRTDLTEEKARDPASPTPKTPPQTSIPAPVTTVTPPTPVDRRNGYGFPQVVDAEVTNSPESLKSKDSFPPDIVVSPSGNMISHRRVRSASAVHKPSRLSSSISALSPAADDAKASSSRTPSAAQSGFFSSMFSAAQNAASSFSNNFNPQSKPRSSTQHVSAETDAQSADDGRKDSNGETSDNQDQAKKPMAVDTLGSGDLNFSHLDIDVPPGGVVSTTDGVVVTKPDLPPEKRKNTIMQQRDEETAKLEDKRAARAVDMAYERPEQPPEVVAVPTEDNLELQSASAVSLPRDISGDHTPPTGSILDGDYPSELKRSGSVRSRLARRRHRGSSGATTSTIGAIGSSAIALGVPAANSSIPRLTGFAVASKKRNRDFHQLFRSVPEDDYLIEDYSCALQREIILAGRIYVSEGHICFSSNILGWVTTLVISFDEVVAVEKETTAMVFPNAIAIQTLHARHIFRSLLSRESTYDLMVNIWKINHPALKSSVNGTRVSDGTGDKTEKASPDSDVESEDSDDDEVYDEDEEDNNADSMYDGSVLGSDGSMPVKGALSRQTSGTLPTLNGTTPTVAANGGSKGDRSGTETDMDFPGPRTHAPTEYTDSNGQYDKLIKDEVVPAPLGMVYNLVFGPASGAFISKFLVENQKSGELQFEGEKKGLTNESRTRQYSYIKPLNASIGPKQTKCISTEYLDFLDLEKAVLVTLTTQTPDVPSGNVFATKTKYLFTWAPGNQTRFYMSCTIEWTGKSWLKGPIEKGAIDGQTTFGNELVKSLKAAIAPRGRVNGAMRPNGKGKGRRKKGSAANQDGSPTAKAATTAGADQAGSWGIFEPLRGILGPVSTIAAPLWNTNVAVLIICILVFMLFFRSPSPPSILSHDIGCPGYTLPQRLAAYEEMWRREESELWTWLEDRVGMDGMVFPTAGKPLESRQKPNRKLQSQRALAEKLSDGKMSDREMDYAIRTTRERLDTLEEILKNRKAQWTVADDSIQREL